MRSLLILILMCLIFSCKHDLEKIEWQNDILVPVAHSDIDINKLFNDSSIEQSTNNEGLITLVFQDDFANLNLDTLLSINTIADEQSTTLDSVTFLDVVISDTATIGEAITQIPLGTLLLPNGSTNQIPDLPGVASNDTINVNASQYFETMTLYKGDLIVEFFNGYPTDVSNVSLSLINASSQNLIAEFQFPIIYSGTSETDTFSVAGQTLDENIIAIIHNMDVNQSNGPVLINYNDAIITKITVSDIGIIEATAFFPEQQITDKLAEHSFDMGSAQIKEIGIKEGTVSINVLSTLPNGKIIYNIPSLKKNGISFSTENIVPQTINGEITTYEFDFSGYILDLTGQDGRIGGDTVNTIYTESYSYIDSTGELEYINQTDSFYSFIEFNIIPEYAIGYLGQDTIEIGPNEKEIKLFDKITSGSISLDQAQLYFNINNYIGAEGALVFKQLNIQNTNTGNTINGGVDVISGNSIIGHEYLIERADLINNTPLISPHTTNILLDAKNMLEIMPNLLTTHLDYRINPNGPQIIDDFLYPDKPINASLNLEIPLNFSTNNLTLIDTLSFSSINNKNIEKLYLTVDNGFPFSANLELLIIDQYDNILDTLFQNTISEGIINEDGMVIEQSTTTLQSSYSNINDIKKIIAKVALNTIPEDEMIKIYDSYNISLTLSVKIKNNVNQ